MIRRLAICGLLLASTGCAKKNEPPTDAAVRAKLAPVIKKHPEARSAFEALEEADEDALEAKPVKDAKPLAKKLRVSGSVSQSKLEEEGILLGNPGFVVGKSSESGMQLFFWPLIPDTSKCHDLFAKGLWGTNSYVQPPEVELNLEALEKVHHVIFIRVRDYTAPHAEFNEFTPGEAKGDVLVYTIPEAKRVAAYPLEFVQKLKEASVKKSNKDAELETMFKSELVKHAIDMVAAGD